MRFARLPCARYARAAPVVPVLARCAPCGPSRPTHAPARLAHGCAGCAIGRGARLASLPRAVRALGLAALALASARRSAGLGFPARCAGDAPCAPPGVRGYAPAAVRPRPSGRCPLLARAPPPRGSRSGRAYPVDNSRKPTENGAYCDIQGLKGESSFQQSGQQGAPFRCGRLRALLG